MQKCQKQFQFFIISGLGYFINYLTTSKNIATYGYIIASDLSVGIYNGPQMKNTINISQLRQNSRSRLDKNSGRKHPIPNDTDLKLYQPQTQKKVY